MSSFRWLLVQLLVMLCFFLSIERFDFGQKNIIDIHSFVYVIGAVAVVSTILLPAVARLSVSWVILFWLFIYMLFKLLMSDDRSIFGGIYTYLTLTEAAFVLLLAFLAHQVARHYAKLQQTVEYLTLADAGRHLLKIADADQDISREMWRSRHFHRALSVIIIKPDKQSMVKVAPRLMEEIQQNVAELWTAARLSHTIKEQLRTVDMVMEDQENGRFIVLCPEIDAQGANVLTDRIGKALSTQLGVTISCGVASFPKEALTFETLLAEADNHLKMSDDHAGEAGVYPMQQERVRAAP
ncbi:MAG: hypothetical protein HND44_14880 [Chloroflexi bacterium]|nr:hypothetical protein [Ardenticatenaceae bacterium]MBL1129748.1 hypothetical protein [Chloroflexota bacterium]NOG35830.1 hypothetical protein [Chloroflexota bacterium]GIK57927.1 MAG: hypothetical protein BroJett015_35900 [Chloroflexota bacterium]